MSVTKINLQNFTAFKNLEVEFSPGINALVGANGTGKTHLMKACYAACEAANADELFAQKLLRVFRPSGLDGGRLVRQKSRASSGRVEVEIGPWHAYTSFDTQGRGWNNGQPERLSSAIRPVYIPSKEMLANAPGFLSLHKAREIHFEDIYPDILTRAYLPVLRDPLNKAHGQMLDRLESEIGGGVTVNGEEFFLNSKQGDIEFTLLAEGFRKLGLLWLLIRNGTLRDGSVLFWDEPEANLNPKMFRVVIQVLLELQRAGVQVFFATHDYVILKELDLQMTEEDAVAFHSLYRDEDGEIACHTTSRYLEISPNAIDEAFDDLYDREIERSLGGLNR